MFVLNEDLSIYVTRGDVVFFTVTAEDEGTPYIFQPGDVVRMKIYGKKNAENVVLQKDFPVTEATENVYIYLEEKDTKIGDVISKPTDYWYEVELNPFTNPQTIIGYDDDGAKIFKLFPEGKDLQEEPVDPEVVAVVDKDLDLTSSRPVENRAIARAVTLLRNDLETVDKRLTGKIKENKTAAKELNEALLVERARIDNLLSGATAEGSEVVDIRVGVDGTNYDSAGTAVRSQITNLSAECRSSFCKAGYANNYISGCKVFTDEHEYLMLSDIRRNYDGETGFRIYSCDETGKNFSYVSTVSLDTDFVEGKVEHSFGENSLLSCYLDLTAMSDGGRQTGDGTPFVLKRDCFLPANSYLSIAKLKDALLAACNTDPKKILTWVDDDTPVDGVASVKAICDNLGVKCSFATITQGWTDPLLELLRQYQKEGFHITCHTESHGRWYKDMPEGDMFTAQEMETDLLVSLEKMRAEGFLDCDMLVYPGSSSGRTDVDTIGIVKKWCRCGVLAGGSTWSNYGKGKYKINRTFIAKSSYDTSYYKNLLDSVSDEAWVVFGTHSGSTTDFDADMVTDIFSYALENGWAIMPLNEALKYREKYYHIQEMLGL